LSCTSEHALMSLCALTKLPAASHRGHQHGKLAQDYEVRIMVDVSDTATVIHEQDKAASSWGMTIAEGTGGVYDDCARSQTTDHRSARIFMRDIRLRGAHMQDEKEYGS